VRFCIITVGKSRGFDLDSAADRDMSDLCAYLTANGVRLGIRCDLLRFSFHIYNNQDDVDRALDLVRQWTKMRARSVGWSLILSSLGAGVRGVCMAG
jgi:hypothetical protein